MSKTELWNRVFTTDPAAVKAITGKQYQGNSPKPYWIVQRLTEEFGPCGIGWGFSILNERMERLIEPEILHVAVIRFWYVLEDGKRGELEQIGQTKATYTKKDGSLMFDEDAPKKSVTDALVKCASYIGFAGDIFSGMWDDSKYVESARQYYAPQPKSKRTGVMADVLDSLPELDEAGALYYAELADNVETLFTAQGIGVALDRIDAEGLENEQKLYLNARLGSKVRSALKMESKARREATGSPIEAPAK